MMILVKNFFINYITLYYIYIYLLPIVLVFFLFNSNIFLLKNISVFKYQSKLITVALYLFFLNLGGVPLLPNFIPKIMYISYVQTLNNFIFIIVINFIVFYFYLKNVYFLKYHSSFIYKNINMSRYINVILVLLVLLVFNMFIGYYFNILFLHSLT